MQYKNRHIDPSAVLTIRTIRIVRRSVHPLRTNDIAQKLNTTHYVAYRILLSLESEGIVERDGVRWCESDGLWGLVDGEVVELVGQVISSTPTAVVPVVPCGEVA